MLPSPIPLQKCYNNPIKGKDMKPDEIIEIDVDSLTEGQAEEYYREIIDDDIANTKSSVQFMGIMMAITFVISFLFRGKGGKLVEYGSWGAYAYFGNYAFPGLFDLLKLKRVKKKINKNALDKTYKELLAHIKDYYLNQQDANNNPASDSQDKNKE